MNHFAHGWRDAGLMRFGRARIPMLLVALLVVALTSWIIVQQVAAGTGTIRIDPDFNTSDNTDASVGVVQPDLSLSEQEIPPPEKIIGDTVTLDIVISGVDLVDPVTGVNLEISYEQDVLDATGVEGIGTLATFLERNSAPGFVFELDGGTITNNGAGNRSTVTYIAVILNGGVAVSGQGLIARITFDVVGAGNLGDANILITGADGDDALFVGLPASPAGFMPLAGQLGIGITDIQSNVSTLSGLTAELVAGDLADLINETPPQAVPLFDPANTFDATPVPPVPPFTHTADVIKTVTTVDFTATPTDLLANVGIFSIDPATGQIGAGGVGVQTETSLLNREGLAPTTSTFDVVVTSSDGLNTSTYRVIVTRALDDMAPTLDAVGPLTIAPDSTAAPYDRTDPNNIAGDPGALASNVGATANPVLVTFLTTQTGTDETDPAPAVTLGAGPPAPPFAVGVHLVPFDITDFAGNVGMGTGLLSVASVVANTDGTDGFTNGQELSVGTDANFACSDDDPGDTSPFGVHDYWPPNVAGPSAILADNVVNNLDLTAFAIEFRGANTRFDFGNFDGDVDIFDFIALTSVAGTDCTGFAP